VADVIVTSNDAQALPILTNHPYGLALLMGRKFEFGTELNASFSRCRATVIGASQDAGALILG
jgi:hypothetical protein